MIVYPSNCKNNRNLEHIGTYAFSGVQELDYLDLSRSRISYLPTEGLINIKTLVLQEVPSLKLFPSVFKFSRIHTAKLTYPHHCCAFSHANVGKPKQDQTDTRTIQSNSRCPTTTSVESSTEDFQESTIPPHQIEFRVKRQDTHFKWQDADFPPLTEGEIVEYDNNVIDATSYNHDPIRNRINSQRNQGRFSNFNNKFPTQKPIGEFGQFGNIFSSSYNGNPISNDPSKWHGTVSPHNETKLTFCGDILPPKDYSAVVCTPSPNALNPCEDVMGYSWLRVLVWFVLLAAIFGNLVVFIVLRRSRTKLTVPKFLMCNLSIADLLMGLYLLLIASVDVYSLGEYFTLAVSWQNDGGCQIAGFLTVFSSEMSVFVLMIITLERWYAISHAIHINRRLRMKQAAVLMCVGWIYALFMAILPLTGVSGYGTVSICLPMEAKDNVDITYIVSLLVFNGIAFAAICGCYISMFLQVRASENMARSKDATIAKRMAILVITNFICWAPIAFFGLTASFGMPLIDITRSKILLVFFYPFNSCVNPFLYAIVTKQFRRDVFLLLGRHGICVEKANRYKGTSMGRSHSNSRINGQLINALDKASKTTILSQYKKSPTNSATSNCSGELATITSKSPSSFDKVSPSPKKFLNEVTKSSLFTALISVVESSRSPRSERKLSTVAETSHGEAPSINSDDRESGIVTSEERVLEGRDSLRDLFDGKPHGRVRSASEYVVIYKNPTGCDASQSSKQQHPVNTRADFGRHKSVQRQISHDTVLSSNTTSSFFSESGTSRADSDFDARLSSDHNKSSRPSAISLGSFASDRTTCTFLPNGSSSSGSGSYTGRKEYSDYESMSETDPFVELSSSQQRKEEVRDNQDECGNTNSQRCEFSKSKRASEVIFEEDFQEEDEEYDTDGDDCESPSPKEAFDYEPHTNMSSVSGRTTVKPMWYTSRNGNGSNRKVSFSDWNMDTTKIESSNSKKGRDVRYSFLRRKKT